MNLYYLSQDSRDMGPYSIEQIKSMWSSGVITANCIWWTEGMGEWRPIGELHLHNQLKTAVDTPSAPIPQYSQTEIVGQISVVPRTHKSRGVFIMLGLLMGLLGFHNFYAGFYGRGAVQCVLGTLSISCYWNKDMPIDAAEGWTGIFCLLVVWVIVELIGVKIDARGEKMI